LSLPCSACRSIEYDVGLVLSLVKFPKPNEGTVTVKGKTLDFQLTQTLVRNLLDGKCCPIKQYRDNF
jgi:hypothetical protein